MAEDDPSTWPRPPASWPPGPHQIGYRATRENVTRLLETAPDTAGLPVPACPGWNVLDLVAHLVQICESGRSPTAGPDALESVPLADRPLADLLRTWARSAELVEQQIETGALRQSAILVMDAFSHELDIFQAAGVVPPPREHPSYPIALHVVTAGFSASVRGHGLPALMIETAGARWQAGSGTPVATVRAPHYLLLRTLTGRRSPEQISELDWSTDPGPWLPAFRWGPFTPPPGPAIEVAG